VVARRQLKRRYVLAFFKELSPSRHRGLRHLASLVARVAALGHTKRTLLSLPLLLRVSRFP